MELLLNIFWLMFALLTVGVWWHGATSVRSDLFGNRLPQFVLLSCVLILLFPVVSVTDDLHPIRPEMEESNPSKKIKSLADKSSNHPGVAPPLDAHVIGCFSFSPESKFYGRVLAELFPVPQLPHLFQGASRAPPAAALI